MKKRASVFVESMLVFGVILCCFFIALPFLRNANEKEKNIVKWSQRYSNIEYAFDVLKAQTDMANADMVSLAFRDKLKMFLREEKDVSKIYKPNFMNYRQKNNLYTFSRFFLNRNGIVLGFKWVNPKCDDKQLCAVMSVDINGLDRPNVWGKDVFGVNFYRNKVEPAGKDFPRKELKKDCSKQGSGVYCSAYYLLGGLVEQQ